MDTEKIKQMGRDYFKANGPQKVSITDAVFWKAWTNEARETGDGLLSYSTWAHHWRTGFNEARYAASKEGRAIELLGRMQVAQERGGIDALTWQDVGEFLQEIGWKPTP